MALNVTHEPWRPYHLALYYNHSIPFKYLNEQKRKIAFEVTYIIYHIGLNNDVIL